jgi:hypothetical protein
MFVIKIDLYGMCMTFLIDFHAKPMRISLGWVVFLVFNGFFLQTGGNFIHHFRPMTNRWQFHPSFSQTDCKIHRGPERSLPKGGVGMSLDQPLLASASSPSRFT